jgi:hypothetical protein
MRQPKTCLALRSLLLAAVSLGVSDQASVNDPSPKHTKLAQVSADTGGGQLRFDIQAQKNLQMPEYLRRSDCITGEECEEYSGLPNSELGKSAVKNFPGKNTIKNLKKPFIGLSITAPLQ